MYNRVSNVNKVKGCYPPSFFGWIIMLVGVHMFVYVHVCMVGQLGSWALAASLHLNPPLPRSHLPKSVFGLLAVASATVTALPYTADPPPPPHTQTPRVKTASSLRLNTPVGRLRHTLCQYNSVLASSKRAHFCDLRTLNHIYIVSSFCFN